MLRLIRTHLVVLLAVLGASLIATAPAPAQPDPTVTFVLHGLQTIAPSARPYSGRTLGTFTATGAVRTTLGKFADKFYITPAGALRIKRTLTTDSGQITMNLTGAAMAGNQTTTTIKGRWTVTGGTRAYAGIKGSGKFTSTLDGAIGVFAEKDTGQA